MDTPDPSENQLMTDPNPDPRAGEPTPGVDLPSATVSAEVRKAASAARRGRDIGNVELKGLRAFYGGNEAVKGIDLAFDAAEVTAIIGPSGCGKSTMVRCVNRMHEEIPGARASGRVLLDDTDVYGDGVDVVAVRRVIGMVFQKPNPFPTMSIFDNVAAGLRLSGMRGVDVRERVERSLIGAGLWEEVKDRLGQPGVGLSGGQQQRLCIARTIAVEPDVILMDEPCSALDPIATSRIEDLMTELKNEYTIVIVTHNMQQAARVSDMTAFMTTDVDDEGGRTGRLVEYDSTDKMFTNPADSRTEGYITGRFG